MARPLRPPPSLELNVRWNFGTVEKKDYKKSFFFLNGPALYPPPLLMARPLREELLFSASLTNYFHFRAVPLKASHLSGNVQFNLKTNLAAFKLNESLISNTRIFSKVYRKVLRSATSLQNCCHEEIKIKFRLVHRLDGSIPFHTIDIYFRKKARQPSLLTTCLFERFDRL